MVKKVKKFYTIADWRKDNPIEADFMDLIHAATSYADQAVAYTEVGAPEEGGCLQRVDDQLTELELAIHRASLAIRAMMNTAQARKAVGLRPKGRGKTMKYDPEKTELSDSQVKVVLAMLRREIDKDEAYLKIDHILSPKKGVDHRTLDAYVNGLIQKWFLHVDRNYRPFWVLEPET